MNSVAYRLSDGDAKAIIDPRPSTNRRFAAIVSSGGRGTGLTRVVPELTVLGLKQHTGTVDE